MGLKPYTEAMGCHASDGGVGKRSKCSEVEGVTDHGAFGSENADISNDKRWLKSISPQFQGFLGKVRPPRVSRELSRGRRA